MLLERRHLRATERDLARLADGSLAAKRRSRVERLVAASAELQSRLRDQRCAVVAVQTTLAERAPLALRTDPSALAVERRARSRALAASRTGRARTTSNPLAGRLRAGSRRIGVAFAGTAVTVVCLVIAFGGGQAAPTVAQAATIAARSPTSTVTDPPEDQVTLPRLRAAGLPFPYWEDRFGWVATGAREDRVGGRVLTTVFYRRAGHRLAYTIVSGAPVSDGSSARALERDRVALRILSAAGDQRIVTWLRRGHTCVLSGVGTPVNALVKLAAWRGHGAIPY